jgi:hypothetical protein
MRRTNMRYKEKRNLCGSDHCAAMLAALRKKRGAGEESRTLDLNLGKVALYQLSYSRDK